MANTHHDLTIGLLGREVPHNSSTIVWKNGYKTVLPTVHDDYMVNVCAKVDIPIIQYLAESPESTPDSIYTTHLLGRGDSSLDLHDLASDALSQSKPVVIRGGGSHLMSEKLTTDFLDKSYAISPGRAVWVHDVMARSMDHTKVTKASLLSTFVRDMNDPSVIQCILDIPLAQVALPDSLKKIDHGLVHGWNTTTYDLPIKSNVHPENFTVKGWALLHHAGFLTYPHHDAEGTLTWLRMEVGIKFWVVFRAKNRYHDRKHLQDLACKLGNFTEHEAWIRENCESELITLLPGDILIIPPGQLHAVYTPVASLATGGHFYHYGCMHLTELSRYMDVVVGDCLTNQNLNNALETLRRMVIAIPRLSPRIPLFERSLLALCTMATHGKEYRAKGGSKRSVADSETAAYTAEIANAVLSYLGVTKRKTGPVLLYRGDQFDRGALVERDAIAKVLLRFTVL